MKMGERGTVLDRFPEIQVFDLTVFHNGQDIAEEPAAEMEGSGVGRYVDEHGWGPPLLFITKRTV